MRDVHHGPGLLSPALHPPVPGGVTLVNGCLHNGAALAGPEAPTGDAAVRYLALGLVVGFAAGMTGTALPTVSAPACAAVVLVTCLLAHLATATPARLMLRHPGLPDC